jgi:hypothetical protein
MRFIRTRAETNSESEIRAMKFIRSFSEAERAVIAIISVMMMVTAMLIYLLLTAPLKNWAG